MSSQEFKQRKLLEDATFYIKNSEEDETFIAKCNSCMDEAERTILDNPRESFKALSSEVIVMYIEVALLTNTRDESASRVNDIFFQRIKGEDQFFCRALLTKASIEQRKITEKELKGDDNYTQVVHAFSFVKRAIEIAAKPENKQKYQFIIYNASIKTWQIIRGLMRLGWSKSLVEILEKVSNLLEDADDFDFNWRCRYLNCLVKAMFDAEKKPEALKVFDKLVDLTKKRGGCNFQETLFRNRIHLNKDNAAALAGVKKDTEGNEDPLGLKNLFIVQQIKSGIFPEAQIEKELQGVIQSIVPPGEEGQGNQAAKVQSIQLDRLAECGRQAVKYGYIKLAENACSVVMRAGQATLRAQIWTEYTKAELLLRKPSADIDPKSGMKLNTLQRQVEDFERRIEALKLMDRAMIANKRLADADITIEGCYIIWNMSLPLLKNSTRSHTYKPFCSASQALELIQANDNQLRVNLHLELAKYEVKQDFLSKAVQQLRKCLNIDYSITLKAVQVEIKEDDDPGNFQRPQDKIIKFLLKKLDLKTNLYGGDPETVQDQIILDVENAKTTRNAKMRETLLDKALKALQEYEEPEYKPNPEKDLVEEEIIQEQKQFNLRNIKERKERVMISNEMAKLAFEESLIDLAYDSAMLATADEWDPFKDHDLIMSQSESHAIIAKCFVEYLLEEEIEIGHKELVTLDDDQEDREFTNEDKTRFQEQKIKFTEHIIKAIKLGSQANQTWLIFNGAVEFWNNYLPIFKNLSFYEIILEQGVPAMIESFEGMNNCFENAQFSHDNVDYELSKKMSIFSNLSIMLARMHEFQHKNDEAVRVCDILLSKQLPSHLRKTFDSIKARVTKQISQGAPKAQPAGGKGGKGEVTQAVAETSKADQVSSEVLGYLELIKNGNKEMIQKAMETLAMWIPDEQEEIELELNAELWCRLGRSSIDQETNAFIKIALYCAEMAITNGDQKIKKKQYLNIPITRLRWYSVSECLYGESLYKLLDTKKQEKESQDKLLHAACTHFVESCNIASKAGIGYLLLESCKCMWNAILGLLDAPNNRRLLIRPLSQVHQYLKDCNEVSDPDFLSLLYSALFLCIQEQKDWKLGERIVEEAFKYVPQAHQKVLWEAKMNFLSKLGKNVLSAISNMKESNASLMAKVWVKLARSSAQDLEQHSAYNKAIEILRKEESVEVVEVLIEYAEWMHRKRYSSQDVEDQLLLAVDILMDIEPGWDEDEGEEEDGDDDNKKSRKTGKSKSSKYSKGSRAKTNQTKKSRASKGGKSVKKSMAGKSKMSNASKRSKSMRSGSSRTSKTKTSMSARQEEDGQPMFLNCSHFEKLVRIHSMLATIAHDSTKQREYALDAHFFVMKMWEQSFQCLNATLFYEEHKAQIEELGFSGADKESRQMYFQEVVSSNEIGIPTLHALPETPEQWASFSLPEEFTLKATVHEDKIMISKYSFMKPELTQYHLQNVIKLLDNHYFSIQQLPVLHLLQLFSTQVLNDNILREVAELKTCRLLMNLGLKETADNVLEDVRSKSPYVLNDEERKVNFEKIKALRDPNDDLKNKNVPFNSEEDGAPMVLEQIRIHESWLQLAEEHIKWGHYVKSKELLKEVNLHARILKDQSCYARSLLSLSTIAYLEGESGSALKLDMLCHSYAQDMEFIETSVVHTNDLLMEFGKIEDCRGLLDGSIAMLIGIKDSQGKEMNQQSRSASATNISTGVQNNLPLDNALSTCYLLKAALHIKEIQANSAIDEQESIVQESFNNIDKFESQLHQVGCNQSHLIRLLKYAHILQSQITSSMSEVNLKTVSFAKLKLERCAKILLEVQELVTEQMYYIGIHQDSNQSTLSLPLTRLLGVVKIRLAQINTDIGVMKNNLKQSSSSGASGNSLEETKKLDRVVATFMDAVTKQIEAQSNTYDKEMNRYEKSITMLESAVNMIHSDCPEHAECIVEIARCKRLLAVNKKHLRGQWRQDAIEVDEVSLNQSMINAQDGQDRKDMLDAKGLEGEVADTFIDYKKEALKAFVNILEVSKETKQPTPVQEQEKDKKGKDAVVDQEAPAKYTTFTQLANTIGGSRLENVLATFSLEYAESRGNLNKEQSFFYLGLFQYALSRQELMKSYLRATNEKHPDVQRLRQCNRITQDFGQFTTPYLPESFEETEKTLKSSSKPFQILNQHFDIEDMKENLPHSTAYLILQLSDDEQYFYCGLMNISRDRKITYNVSKLQLKGQDKQKLFQMVTTLAQNKTTMQKTPITIEEDLINLEHDSNVEIIKLIEQLEAFFKPITEVLDPIINIVFTAEDEEAEVGATAAAAKGGKKEAPKDDKKGKGAPAKAGKGGGAEAQLATYESSLPLPVSGIESIILLIDSKLQSLPFESLEVFKEIPVVARDFNLHMHFQRLKELGHQADLHNNKGIDKNELSYIIDPPSSLNEKAKDLVQNQIPGMLAGAQWNGILTSTEHAPSVGEWQERISKSSMFAYYSMTCLLHKFPPSLVADLSIFSKCRAMLIFDRMNSYKTLIDRDVVTSRHFVPSEQPMQEAALFSLCGVQTIITNHWATKPEDNLETFTKLLQSTLQDGIYLGAGVKRYFNGMNDINEENQEEQRTAKLRKLFRYNTCTYGVPIIRVV